MQSADGFAIGDCAVIGSAQAAEANSRGHAAMKAGDSAQAERLFAQAVALDPASLQLRTNHAIALVGQARFGDALATLLPVEAKGLSDAAYCSTRGTVERGLGRLAAAAQWYDAALALEPGRVRALHGRARTAIERGEEDALARFDAALARNPGDADLWLGKAQALDVAGDADGARAIAQQIAAQAPHMAEGLKFLAQLRLAEGDANPTSHYADAVRAAPLDPNIPVDWARHLGSLERHAEAAEVIARARSSFPDLPYLALLEAIYLDAAGDIDAAETLFASLAIDNDDRWTHEARHALRRGELDRAEAALARALRFKDANISAWALRDFVWRLTGDTRQDWLHGQDGLVRMMPLRNADLVLPAVVDRLHALHDASPFPLGQSLRGGTQTRGRLFDRHEPAYAALAAAIERTLEEYRDALPPADPTHPLLRHRDGPWRIAGSWSVRLTHGGDHHAAHLHPEGIVSSACYLQLPPVSQGDDADPQAGWIELGRPPPDLSLDLGPRYVLEPREGHMALFPSTLYHGTRAFGAGQRMTVAFDAVGGEGTRP